MKAFCYILFIALSLVLINISGYSQGCGNDHKNGTNNPSCGCRTCPGDPFDPYTGNESRAIMDLEIWGGTGEHQLTWMRYGNSRNSYIKNRFGSAHRWNFSYNYNMIDQGTDQQGNAQIFIHYPEGGSNVFTHDANNPSIWLPVSGVGKRLFQQGNNFYLQMLNGFRYRFEKLTNPSGYSYYQLQDFKDSYQNLYVLTYDKSNRLQRITEPAGRYLQITYSTVNDNPNIRTDVATNDGRSVHYTYDVYTDSLRDWVRLIAVNYGDGTKALYTYSQKDPGVRPRVEHAIDPRYTGKDGNMIVKYNPDVSAGFIQEERNGVTGELMATLFAGSDDRRVCYPNGRTEHYYMPRSLDGRLKEFTDGLGRKTVYNYDMGGNGFINSEKDALGRVTSYKKTIYDNPLETTYP